MPTPMRLRFWMKENGRLMNKWTTKFPTEPGLYWFYGYRYGKISCGSECDPELMLAQVITISDGTMVIANGQFVQEKEVEQAHFMKCVPPKFPELK